MAEQVFKPHLDQLFDDVSERMKGLADKGKGKFTSQDFVKSLARDQSLIYIDLLVSTRDYLINKYDRDSANTWVFNEAHQAIGNRLSREATNAGYKQVKGKRDEEDIHGNPTNRVTYHRQ